MYCLCRHHYRWDRNDVTYDSDTHHDYDWAHDCQDWFSDHRDWDDSYGNWDHDDDQSAHDTNADHLRCEDHGHDNWNHDCDEWYEHRHDSCYSPTLRLKPVVNSVAFEDLYYPTTENSNPPRQPDYDYNDFLTAFKITEQTNSNNDITAINIDFYPRAVGAGYDHSFLLVLDGLPSLPAKNLSLLPQTKPMFNGTAQVTLSYYDQTGNLIGTPTHPAYNQDIVVFPSTHAIFGGTVSGDMGSIIDSVVPSGYTSGIPSTYITAKLNAQVHIVLNDPRLNPAPADGRIDASGFRVILHPKPTDLDEDIINVDPKNFTADGYPWGFIIPTDWRWPRETININNGYPMFQDYRNYLLGKTPTDGSDYMHWYNYPSQDADDYLYPVIPFHDFLPPL